MTRGTRVVTIETSCTLTCECGYETVSKTGMRLHRKVTHGLGAPDTIDITHRCDACRVAFENGPQLTAHHKHAGH
jgi:hypothetical protein